ncbi:MAG: NAD(P)-dependent glycerol-3-phosphate dehydrogenase [Ignavibacteriaceae bacterium]|jgi:Glycerol-3-phosphate dehydrogenase|nr:MAG: NAD(P)-dependent glycerol-3-phosphate dehydrogenase [Chlorobiota bacterium]KXK03171.1 MAG: NAD(P)H-dependent glycerol-3-phosphate dehydrogenase [Chlorobi bacterium OLB4]MBV6399630.1 Glycerol-3-phosphate dehydrogenase [NAD(P)+] [Ignavibacteria bacterium]MCC6886347.1 NAD(P)-dependent glycerol-3-phosphate dehydrogenase [Ignavibacteriales bacterium]MCE7953786.1 NAD(P)-dependent glycerol-3-phosphate dehydrogenase [Chlorobi bacterium CHB7]MDL1887720.1 NAD(P)-dependent glycerol-3-phosphate de
MKVSVLGAGGWGTSLAILLHENSNSVTLWEFNKEYSHTLDSYRENFYYLPKVKIPSGITITNDLYEAATGKDVIIISTPTQYIRSALKELKNATTRNSLIVNVSKGIENDTLMLVNDIIQDIIPDVTPEQICCVSGPSHAEEVSRKIPTAVVCASNSSSSAKTVQDLMSNNYFRVYTCDDVTGVELSGALKNVIAIATGIADGAGFGDNTKAAIMTRGLNEIMKMGLKAGARMETFFGLSGVGDLIVTCSSPHSRNRFVGQEIGKGKSLETVLTEMKMVAEGVATSRSALMLSELRGIEMPIVKEVNEILFNKKDPLDATNELMLRSLKSEI